MNFFLKLFGVEEVNGISPFSVDMDSPADLLKLIKYLFCPPKRDLRDNIKNENSTDPSDNGESKEDDDANHKCTILLCFVNNVHSMDLDKDKDHKSIDSRDTYENHCLPNNEV